MSEKWAQDCAKYEEGGAAEYLKAALEYERRSQTKSGQEIADAVTEAGFPIHKATVNRRLAALLVARATRLRANSKDFLAAFADAYAGENAKGRGGQTSLDPDTARSVWINGAVGEFQRLFAGAESLDLSEEDINGLVTLQEEIGTLLIEITAGAPDLAVVR